MSPCVEEIDIQQQSIDALKDFIEFLEKQELENGDSNE